MINHRLQRLAVFLNLNATAIAAGLAAPLFLAAIVGVATTLLGTPA